MNGVWLANLGSGDWNTGTNGSPRQVAPGNTLPVAATFDTSTQTLLTLSKTTTLVGITLNPGAIAFPSAAALESTITADPPTGAL